MKKLIILFILLFSILSIFAFYDKLIYLFDSRYYRLSNKLLKFERLTSNEYLESLNGNYRFILQNDGNLLLTNVSLNEVLWTSGTFNSEGIYLTINHTGKLILYTVLGKEAWVAKNSIKSGADKLVLENDGSLILYAGTKIIWSTIIKNNYVNLQN